MQRTKPGRHIDGGQGQSNGMPEQRADDRELEIAVREVIKTLGHREALARLVVSPRRFPSLYGIEPGKISRGY